MFAYALRAVPSEPFNPATELNIARKRVREFSIFKRSKSLDASWQALAIRFNIDGWATRPLGWLDLLLAYGEAKRKLMSSDRMLLIEPILNAYVPNVAAAQRLLLTLMPKAELHVHLDGSMTPEFIFEQAQIQGVDLRAAIPRLCALAPAGTKLTLEHVRAYQSSPQGVVTDWEHFLSLFNLSLTVLQTPEALAAAALDLMRQGHEEHVTHMEIRFAPMLHDKQGLSYHQICEALLSGMAEGQSRYGMTSALILAVYRNKIGDPGQETHDIKTAECASDLTRYYSPAIPIGFDVVGKESPEFPLSRFQRAFEIAGNSPGVWITAHAGESPGTKSQRNLITAAKWGFIHRIGHGIHALDLPANMDRKLLKRLKKMTFEVCPTSNVQLGCTDSHETHPLKRLIAAGYQVTISTDNRQISGISLTDEYVALTEKMGIPLLQDAQGHPQISDALKLIAAQGYSAAFLPAHIGKERIQYHRDWMEILDGVAALVFGR